MIIFNQTRVINGANQILILILTTIAGVYLQWVWATTWPPKYLLLVTLRPFSLTNVLTLDLRCPIRECRLTSPGWPFW